MTTLRGQPRARLTSCSWQAVPPFWTGIFPRFDVRTATCLR